MPRYEVSELSELKVTVVPRSYEMTNLTRAATEYDFSIDIGIQKKLTTADVETECTELYPLVDEIIDFLRNRQLAQTPWARQSP